MSRWLHFAADHAGWLVGASVLCMVVGAVLVPMLIVKAPPEYFLYEHRRRISAQGRHPLVRLFVVAAKNLLGALLLVVGIALLFLPGQGLLTLVVGLMLMDYPGKYEFERWLVRRRHVLPALNWLRNKYGRPPLIDP